MKIIFVSGLHCPTCRKLEGALHNIDLLDKIEHRIINTAEKDDFDFIKKYKISTLPTLLKVDDNEEEVERLCGLKPLSIVKEFIIGGV